MKTAILATLALVLTACNCATVVEDRRVAGKDYTPEYTSICMTTQSGGIPMNIPIHGGICVGTIEVVAAHYYLILDDGTRVTVAHEAYNAAQEGDPYSLEKMVCD